jgi:beta-phosphoglucomutase-like phosphatase (HAD superfamily)
VLDLSGLGPLFAASVSSEEVARGKPAPDVYLEAATRLEVKPGAAAAVEDSTNGLLAARAAGLVVIAIPNRDFPPANGAVAAAELVLDSLEELTPLAVERIASGGAA